MIGRPGGGFLPTIGTGEIRRLSKGDDGHQANHGNTGYDHRNFYCYY